MKLTLLFLLFFCIVVNCINTNENSEDYDLSSRLSLKDRKLDWQRINSGQSKVLKKRRKGRKVLKRRPSSSENKAKSTFIRPFNRDSRCKLITVYLKITEKVAFNIASEASYVYILGGQKLIKNAKNQSILGEFLQNLKLAVKQCYQTGHF